MALNFIMNKYRMLGKKGEGTFSEVLKCQNIKNGTYFACKKMKQQYESIDQVNSLREIQAMRRLSPHANILELEEVIFDKKSGTLVLICELMDMNIYELIRGRRHYLPEKKIKMFMYQLLKSVDHMHRNGIFHRDVKPENILIKDEILKLADFGSCRSVYSKQPYTEYISTRWYRAPECLLTDGYYTYKMDIWSVGCVFFEIMSLHPLFPGSNEVDQIAKIHNVMGTPEPSVLNKLRNKTRGMNFNFPQKKGTGIEKMLPHASTECVQLIYLMCKYDPDERLSAKQGLRHPYFKDLRDAEKRAAAQAKLQKQEEQQRSLNLNSDKTEVESSKDSDIIPTKVEKARRKKSPKSPGNQSNRPSSGGSHNNIPLLPRYPASILHNRDPVYHLHRKERKRRKKLTRMSEGDAESQNGGLLPKVPIQKPPGSYQPTFHTNSYSTSTLPKINNQNSTATTTYLPSISQAFVKPAKPTKTSQQTAKNMYGHYQLPSIDRRGTGY